MSTKSRARARSLRTRPEVARLRAVGGLTKRVVVDGASVLAWCQRVGAQFIDVGRTLADAAAVGDRELVVVTSVPLSLREPHVMVRSTAGVAALLRGHAFGLVDLPSLPSVIGADVDRDRQLLDVLEAGAADLLDLATGRLWKGDVRDRYDREHAARHGAAAASAVHVDVDSLAEALVAGTRQLGRTFVVCAFQRDGDQVSLMKVAVDDGVRRTAQDPAAAFALLKEVFARREPPVMTNALDVLDAVHDAGVELPAAVEDPAIAVTLLDPDSRAAPPGMGGLWRRLLGHRIDSTARVPLNRVLDELPGVRDELDDALRRSGLTDLYKQDLQPTVPLLAALEREGFHVDHAGLEQDMAAVRAEMAKAWDTIVSGPHASSFAVLDLVHAPKEAVAERILVAEGAPPPGWRTERPDLDRLALWGSPRAKAVRRLRSLDAIHGWMKRIEGKPRLRSVLEPSGTGRWYPHGDPLSTIPKHDPEAMLLRRHLVPPPGHLFVSGDFAAFEPRLLAHQSGDPVLTVGASRGNDIYRHLMPRLGVNERSVAKAALLAFMYEVSATTFANSLPMPSPEGHRIFNALTDVVSKAMAFRDEVQANSTAIATSMYGWRRLRGTASPKTFARQAFNLRMQGSASDLLRKLLRDLKEVLPPEARVVHQEFDAVILTCPATMAARVEVILEAAMEAVADLSVPLVAKTKHGATLADVS